MDYRDLNQRVQRPCREDRAGFMNQTYQEIQNSANKGETRSLLKWIKLLQNFRPRSCGIRKTEDSKVWNETSVLNCWRDYREALYREPGKNTDNRVLQIIISREP